MECEGSLASAGSGFGQRTQATTASSWVHAAKNQEKEIGQPWKIASDDHKKMCVPARIP